jgi:hypothetical protein
MSDSCEIQLTNLGDEKIDAKLFGKGKPAVKRTGRLANGEILIIGGDAENDTGWLIILRKVSAKK